MYLSHSIVCILIINSKHILQLFEELQLNSIPQNVAFAGSSTLSTISCDL